MKRSRVGIIAGVLILLLATTGCSSLAGGKWVAKVNGEKVTTDEFNTRLADIQKAYEGKGLDFSTEQGKQSLEQIKQQLVSRMVMDKLISQEAAKLKLDLKDKNIQDQLANIKTSFGGDEAFATALKQQGMNEEEVVSYLALYESVSKDVKLSDAEIQAYYEKNQDKYGEPEQVKARHILVEKEDEAKAIIEQLKAGASFEKLAKEKSIDGSKEVGGELGYFGKGEMVPEFEKAAFSQKVGTFSLEPVKSEFGYHIIFVDDHKAAKVPAFETIKADVEKEAVTEAKDNKFSTYYDELFKNAKIEYDPAFQPAETGK